MASLRQILAAVGVGMAQVRLRLDEAEHPRGSYITGNVEIEGGIAPQRIRAILLWVIGYRPSGKSTETRELGALMVARGVDVLPRSKQSFGFRFHIPDDAFLTQTGFLNSPSTGCRIDARADIPLAADPRSSILLNVTPHRETQALQSAMRLLGFGEKRPGFTLTWKNLPPERTETHYHPPAALLEQLEDACLAVQVNDGRTTGELDLNPRERELREKLKALVVTNYQVYLLEFEPFALLTADGLPNPHAALPRLQAILEEALVLPDNESNRLLRPVSAPVSDLLLRPARGNDHSKPDELLRPADEGSDQ